jgi:NAD(P)H-hydrate epimerase
MGQELTLSRRQVRQFDELAIKQWGVPSVVLMENAGRNCADAIGRFLGPCHGRKFAIVAGTGNNGGDGFVVARHLMIRGGLVTVFVAGDPDRMSPDAAVNFKILRSLNFDIRPCTGQAVGELAKQLRGFELVVDAVGGTGIHGPLRGETAEVVEQINAAGRPVVAIDIPTGLDCDSGQALGPAVKAALTVTMVARKIGFDAPAAAAYTGQVVVVDIGVPYQSV